MPHAAPRPRVRVRLTLEGRVQGLGFRPFVFRLATAMGLAGGVRNVPSGVVVEVEGSVQALARFRLALTEERPPLAAFRVVAEEDLEPQEDDRFVVWPSEAGGSPTALILPDLATCPQCRAEIFDRTNRRYRYPFTNCTYCGPRFSIVEGIPYDRERTTMRRFVMCSACAAEYHDPTDRRFHAQPNACPRCGPVLSLWDGAGVVLAAGDQALRAAAQAVREGGIVAVKGLGGFQLVCDAGSEVGVARLRRRKRREEKPFAVMAPHLDWIAGACRMEDDEARLLTSSEAPILLLALRSIGAIAENVAPRNPNVGVMLPTTPLHHLLLDDLGLPVVATSGNRSDEPMCIDEREALTRLHDIADVFLVHDRPIARPVDDSVVRFMAGRPVTLRRARGFAPLPVSLSASAPPTLAVGAHLKSSVALAVGSEVFLSQHLGDLETPEARAAFDRACLDLPRLYAVDHPALACDTHPEYHSTRRAAALGRTVVEAVQHHHAHVAACVAENGAALPVLGVAWDGTGHGPDGTVWGGEWLRVDETGFVRVAHLRTFRLPGGDAAAREPRRAALGLLHEVFGGAVLDEVGLAPVASFPRADRRLLAAALTNGINAPRTSSLGRLFDAVAALSGSRQVAAFEGQAAMELEAALGAGASEASPYPFPLQDPSHLGDPLILDWEPMLRAIIEDIEAQCPLSFLSARFHNTLVEAIVAVARRMGLARVALSGGCFQNRYLTERAVLRLRQAGFEPLWHSRVPPNDGGIALGQVVVAAQRSTGGA